MTLSCVCVCGAGFPAELAGGQGPGGPGVMALLRQMHKDHGLRVLFTLPAYKDKSQSSKSTVMAATKADAAILANETWVLGKARKRRC